MAYKYEGKRIFKAVPLGVGAGAVEFVRGKAKRPGFFMKIFRDIQSFRDIDRRIIDKLDKVECRCRLALCRGVQRGLRKKEF